MTLNNIDITKLPPDAKKEFLKYALKLSEKRKQSSVSKDFMAFVKSMWPQFIEGSHHKIIAEKFNRLASGELKRLIVNMPPRHTKSEFASNLFPAWMLGKNPKLKIIQTTHTAELSDGFLNCPSGFVLSNLTLPLNLNSSTKIPTKSLIDISSSPLTINGSVPL